MILPKSSDLEINVVAEIGRISLTLEDMLNWKDNVKVPIQTHENNEIVLSVGKNKIASGIMQLDNEKLYVRITTLLSE